MANIRNSRYTYREELKEDANRHNSLSATHPQARRGIEDSIVQLKEALDYLLLNWEIEPYDEQEQENTPP